MNDSAKIALITGAAKRLGQAIALEMALAGWDIAIHCGKSIQEAELTAQQIRALGRRVTVIQADLADQEDLERVLPQCIAQFALIAQDPMVLLDIVEILLRCLENSTNKVLCYWGNYSCLRSEIRQHESGLFLVYLIQSRPRVGYAHAGYVLCALSAGGWYCSRHHTCIR